MMDTKDAVSYTHLDVYKRQTDLTPNWVLYDFERFPAVQWKLRNLEKLKAQNPTKHQAQYDELKRKLNA